MACGIVAFCLAAGGADERALKRPKVGLVLAGGSAFGLSHIGVLKWMEDNRVPVDAVAGTSMGALIGGAFATGMTAGEVEQFVASIDWNDTLQVSAPFPQLSFRRKEDQREYPNTIELGYKRGRGVAFPSALSAGHGVGLMISRFAAPYGEMGSFNDLPTPFRCVSADLVKARTFVFQSGSLPEALRATMAIPGVFTPVEKDGMLLVDGGMLNNLPVDVVRSMGPDIIVAVALDPPVPDVNEMKSIFGVARRSISVMISDNERRMLGLADLIVMPDLKALGGGDYPRFAEFIARGYQAAESKRFLLEKLAVSEAEYEAWKAARAARRKDNEVRPRDIIVEGDLAPRHKAALIESLTANPDQPVVREHLEAELTKLTGSGRFEAASYTTFKDGRGEGLKLRLKEKDHGPPFVKPAFLLLASPEEGLRFGVGARATFLDFGGPASEWRTDLSIGLYNRLGTEYYHRINGGKWFVAPRIAYEEWSQPLYEGPKRIAEFVNRTAGGGIDLGYAFGRFQEFRVGWTLAEQKVLLATGAEQGTGVTGRAASIRAKWTYEGQDAPNVPTRGVRVNLQGHYGLDFPGVKDPYALAEGLVSYAKPMPRRFIFIGQARGGITADNPFLSNSFELGGPLRMGSLARSQLLGTRYYYGGGYVLRGLSNEALALFGRFYGLVAYEAGNAWTRSPLPLPRHSATIGVMGETQFGVVFFGAAYGDRGEGKIFFRLGRFF